MITFGNIHYNSRNALFRDLADRYHIAVSTARKWYTDKHLTDPRKFDAYAVSHGKQSQLALFVSNQREPEPLLLDLGDLSPKPHYMEESRQILYPTVRSDVRTATVPTPSPSVHVEILYPFVRSDLNFTTLQTNSEPQYARIEPVDLALRRSVKFPIRVGERFATSLDELVQYIWEYAPSLTIDEIRYSLTRIDLTKFMDEGWHLGWLHVYDRLKMDELTYVMGYVPDNFEYNPHYLYMTAFGDDYRLTYHGQLLQRQADGQFRHAGVVRRKNQFGYDVNGHFIDAYVLKRLSQFKDADFVSYRDMILRDPADYTAVQLYTPQGKLVTQYTLTKAEK